MGVTSEGNSLLERIIDTLIPPSIVAFLNQTFYRNPFMVFNYWSFIHFLTGVIFYFLKPQKIEIKTWFLFWIMINISFEIVEYILGIGGSPLFREEIIDIIWDILLSLLGFGLAYFLFKKKK